VSQPWTSRAVARGPLMISDGNLGYPFEILPYRLSFGTAARLSTLPAFDFFSAEAPIATQPKPRQFPFLEKPVDCASVNLKKIRQFFDG